MQFRMQVEYDDGSSQALMGAVDFDRQMADLRYRDEDSEFRAIADGPVTYIHHRSYGGYFGAPWIRLSDEHESLFDLAWFSFFYNPVAFLAALEEATVEIDDLGFEDHGGVNTTRLRIRLNIERLWSVMSAAGVYPEHSEERPQWWDALSSMVDVWVDADRRLVRYVYPAEGTATPADYMFARLEFFAYGEHVEIEIPSDDNVIDWSEVAWLYELFDAISDEPFSGADCYDVDVYRCLDTNPALDELAVDPALCQTDEARLCLVPAGLVRRDVVESIVEFHRAAGIEVMVLPSLTVSTMLVDDGMQVTGDDLYRMAEQRYFPGNPYPSTFIIVAPFDIRPADSPYGWYFGSRWAIRRGDHQHGVFSYFRMANIEPYDGRPLTDELLFERVNKYFGRYTTLLYLGYPMDWDRNYMNYAEMYGFSDLDSMQPNWPDWPAPCIGDEPLICIIPDNDYDDPAFERDLEAVVRRLARELDVRVEMRIYRGHFEPTWDPWSEEYRQDIRHIYPEFVADSLVTVIGITDDVFQERDPQSGMWSTHMERYWHEDEHGFGVVSAHDAGEPGTAEHRERLYRLLLRAIGHQHFGLELRSVAGALLSDSANHPSDLDGAEPVLPLQAN